MASRKPGPGAFSRPSEPVRPNRSGAYLETPRDEFSSAISIKSRREADFSRLPVQSSLQVRTPGRIPQHAGLRRPSLPEQSRRPPLTHQNKSSASAKSIGSIQSVSTVSASTSSSGNWTKPEAKQPHKVLRRKTSNISQDAPSLQTDSRSNSTGTTSSSSISRSHDMADQVGGLHFDRGLTESPMAMHVAQRVELPTTTAQAITIYPELDRYRDVVIPRHIENTSVHVPFRIATHDLPPPTPLFSGASSHSQPSTYSASPSTRFSESPGPGAYSRDTTPTSISSHSPGILAPMRYPPPRFRDGSPAFSRPPVTRRRAGSISNDPDPASADPRGLAAVRESLNSSSSNSTVRGTDKRKPRTQKGLTPSPPNPPPRKSSQKSRKIQTDHQSPSRPQREPSKPIMRSPSPSKAISPNMPNMPNGTRPAIPTRPSRDGTTDLQSQMGVPVPVVHSNLSSTSLPERRENTPLAPSLLPKSPAPPSRPERPQPSSTLPSGREPTPAPKATTKTEEHQPNRSTRTPSPNITSFKTRFPLFGRRTKTAPDAPSSDAKDKATRKGPAAGTGHEGYGKIGQIRRRSNSAGGRGLTGPVSSQESLSSNQSSDPFLRERMNPVVIAGGEIIENRNANSDLTRTESHQSLSCTRPGIDSRNGSEISLSSREESRNTLWPSAFPRGHSKGPPQRSRRPSDSSDSEGITMKPTLAFRRSAQRLKTTDQSQLQLPKPIVVPAYGAKSPSVNSLDTTITSILTDDSTLEFRPEIVPDHTGPGSKTPKKLTKRARSPRKWNFFGRSQSQPPKKEKKIEGATVAATVKVVQTKPVAFYTMMDGSEQEDNGAPDLEEILRDAKVFDTLAAPSSVPKSRRPSATSVDIRIELQKSEPPNGIPQPDGRGNEPEPTTRPEVSPYMVASSRVGQSGASQVPVARPSRLPQVGRIPKVISARPEQTSPKSFSRPFNRISMQMPPIVMGHVDDDSVAKGPSPDRRSTPELIQEESTATASNISMEATPDISHGIKEFLAFAPRKDSQSTSTTTSSCSGILNYADATAIIRDANAPLVEDEIWDEYNDLLGEDAHKGLPSATSSCGIPFPLETYHTKLAKEAKLPLETPPFVQCDTGGPATSDDVEKAPTSSSVYSQDFTAKITDLLENEGLPLTPFSVTEFVSGYGDRNNSVDLGQKQPTPQEGIDEAKAEVTPGKTRISDASTYSKSSEDDSPASQVNIRVGSMTVSKWLTFGHVLFSPVRDELVPEAGSLKRQSILVLDGLGNDDWSFYAAETYPAATFFNLSPRAPLPSDHRGSAAFPLSPPNHHQIQFKSHADKFPFGPESFTSVVYRFPIAAPEAHYRNIITEARRVLKPGGYLELAILDADLNNMGNRGRRTVRGLKERIHVHAPDINLSSTADLITRLMGQKGFADIKTCRVGVPVASAVASSSSEGGGRSGGKGGDVKLSKEKSKGKMKDQRSLAEMMSDESENADEGITNMVSRVGRWWYTRCYETAAAASTKDPSIWSDRAFLAECEEWGTSLKLTVCYARVPDGHSRVASI